MAENLPEGARDWHQYLVCFEGAGQVVCDLVGAGAVYRPLHQSLEVEPSSFLCVCGGREGECCG